MALQALALWETPRPRGLFCYSKAMANILLFSELTETNKDTILRILFPHKSADKSFVYMPSGGIHGAEDYISQWEDIANEYGTQFSVIDNTSANPRESIKLLNADVVLISGGNTFQLLSNLRKSGLDKVIVELSHKQDVTLAGFSAGALVLTPTITICNLPGFDENLFGINDLSGLGIVDFELFPHYEKLLHETLLNVYRETTNNQVREISDEEYISLSI